MRRAAVASEAGWAESNRVVRGGSWNNNDNNLRAANRNNNTPTNRNNNNGFRCAKTEEILAREDALKHRGQGFGARGAPQSSPACLVRRCSQAVAR